MNKQTPKPSKPVNVPNPKMPHGVKVSKPAPRPVSKDGTRSNTVPDTSRSIDPNIDTSN